MLFIALASSGAAAGLLLAAFLSWSLVRAEFRFWPPPAPGAWQEHVFWALFRVYCAALLLVAPLDPGMLQWDHWTRLAVGLPVLVAGTGTMLYGYGFLGLANTYGRPAGLVTDGLYAFSRNPQYVASVAAGLGWALVWSSPAALVAAGGLFALYLLFALNEERWLRGTYGEAYAAYCREVPRFLGAATIERLAAFLRPRLLGGVKRKHRVT